MLSLHTTTAPNDYFRPVADLHLSTGISESAYMFDHSGPISLEGHFWHPPAWWFPQRAKGSDSFDFIWLRLFQSSL